MLNDQTKPLFHSLIRSVVHKLISDTSLYRLIVEKIDNDPQFSPLGCVCVDDLYQMMNSCVGEGVVGGIMLVDRESREWWYFFPASTVVPRNQIYDAVTSRHS